MIDNHDKVAAMPTTEHECHSDYRSTASQMAYLKSHHECEDGDDCEQIVAAETADLLVETMACPKCRPAISQMIEAFVDVTTGSTGNTLMYGFVASLVASVCHADLTIRRGMATYESLPDEVKAAAEKQ